jgi:hypothetical protein
MLRVLLLAFALLAAQHSAAAHDVWHGAGAAQSQQQDNLCKLHDALGTVAGALDATPAATLLCKLHESGFVPVNVAAPGGVAPVPSSRDPPALL